MYDLTIPISNFTAFIKNYSANTYYGITAKGVFFNLFPENSQSNMMEAIYVGISSKAEEFSMFGTQIESNWYRPPVDNIPLYIEELNVILFRTKEERFTVVEKTGNAVKIIKNYAAGTLPLMNASYASVVCLNKDMEYYTLINGEPHPFPSSCDEDIEDLCKKHNITKEFLEVNTVFIIHNILRTGKSNVKETKISSDVRAIKKSTIKKGEPLIFNNNGFVLFDSKESAIEFVHNYVNVSRYLSEKALAITYEKHKEEIELLNNRAKTDKKGMVETFTLMGGTSVISILTENVVKNYVEGDNKEKLSNSIKLLLIGASLIGGAYAAYKYYKKNKEKAKIK